MEGNLNRNQIEYVLFHLNLVFQLTDEIKARLVFAENKNETEIHRGKIVFPLSSASLNKNNIKSVEGIPVLFPCGPSDKFWNIRNDTLFFEDDLLKSTFYLLSGYQEVANRKRDGLGRFSARDSIQFHLGIVHKPVVNYYLEAIKIGIRTFLTPQGITVAGRSLFSPFCFVLTHDVDRVKLYSYNYLVFKLKEILGFKKTRATTGILIGQLWQGMLGFLSGGTNDPAWNFDYLRDIEKEHNLVSGFYFLDDETKHVDADYRLSDQRISALINNLYSEGCEIGLHGNQQSVTSKASMQNGLDKLNKVFRNEVKGIRQHRLRYEVPQTTGIQEQLGFIYDTSLGFFDQEGFRNSFCLPFRLYNFQKNAMAGIWEIPLNVMDCTLMEYRGLSFTEAQQSVENLITEISKFSGVFTLLWHNGYFDEIRFPGIHRYYEEMIARVAGGNARNLTGLQVINEINSAL